MSQTVLRGITWNHSRALPPLVATAQRFEELNPSVRVQWEKRTLHEFGHMSLTDLADHFDLLVVDHPMMGDAHVSGALVDFAAASATSAVDQIRSDSLGPCFESYRYEGCLYALPIDAAAPAASYRPDLLGAKVEPPRTWDDLLALARRGLVAMPGFPADLFLNFMGLCVSLDRENAALPELLEQEAAASSLELLRQLAGSANAGIFEKNPIALYEWMAGGSTVAYCPFAYTYSNYSRDGFAAHPLQFTSSVSIDGKPLRTVLGGTGIAISSRCGSREIAVEYCLLTAGPDWQRTLYGICGGQPASRGAWADSVLNALTRNFFRNTQSSIENAYVRPRYPGYARFQEKAGLPIMRHLRGELGAETALAEIRRLHHQSIGNRHD